MELTIALPALNQNNPAQMPSLHTPVLNELLRFGTLTHRPTVASSFFASFLWQGSLITHAKQALGIAPQQNAVFASPVWQQMGMHNASMLGGAGLGISAQQAEDFCRGLNHFYADSDWHFHVYRPDLWLVETPDQPDWQVPCILDVLGSLDGATRAEGADSIQWMRYETEIQMWLHSCSINTERTAQGQPSVNGIWLWSDLIGTQTFAAPLATDNEWAQAHTGPKFDAPYDYAAWQNLAAEAPVSDRHLIFLDDLADTAHTGDVWTYKHTLEAWDERFFAPAWQALKQGRLKQLTLATDGPAGGTLNIKAKAGRAFWKRKRNFQGNWNQA
ncbi:hypothetical protein HMPREF9370_0332 [Neisseria wadsworthii 9715]|uniref:Uncharacterized protein n=2 Tax=Neisseria TaxID=482 RepID=G4CMM3_9NEIS|nr:hypothetical protein HMPREF9370_0332 [Neisseria wadsworthii 9715]QMT36351.1 hypothetical protein H3L96_03770 [Neisseria wadsworthii]